MYKIVLYGECVCLGENMSVDGVKMEIIGCTKVVVASDLNVVLCVGVVYVLMLFIDVLVSVDSDG